ncbi:glycosyltransferase [Rufibacter aurantiacus]|uniref:glycosyltransferase n=1 Tax=Rufibacter aurantiacus TaxID=2817374 RepID=UPI0024A61789|nr:glycosyltransferase [Rufibacter aurantiacus]
MIPKTIHYCWFGNTQMPAEYKGYVEEWKAFHPSWNIKLWNEDNFHDDSIYFKNAYANGNWANVSNYVRLKVLLEHGGIYLDTDIKVVKEFDDLLAYNCFLGFETGSTSASDFWVNNAVIGACPNHSFVFKCLEKFNTVFDGLEKANESSPQLVTKILIEDYGLKSYGRQVLRDEIQLLESSFFYPIPWNHVKATLNYLEYITSDTYAVHMWGRTWFTKDMLLAMVDDLQEWVIIQEKTISKLKEELEGYKNGLDGVEKK